MSLSGQEAELNEKTITTLTKELNLKGTLHILRYGFKFYGKTFDMAFFKTAHGLNPEVVEFCNKNQLTVTRQVPCGAGNPSHPSGHRAGYYWEETLQKDIFLDIVGHYMFIETKEEKVDDGRGGKQADFKKMMVFPHYHQLDAASGLPNTAKDGKVGHN